MTGVNNPPRVDSESADRQIDLRQPATPSGHSAMRFDSQEQAETRQQSEALPPGQRSVAAKGNAEAEGKALAHSEALADGTAAHVEQTAFALTFRDEYVVATVAVVAISVCCFFYFSRHHVEPAADRLPASIPTVRWEIDINSATWREVAVMRGVGPVLARQIVEDRNSNGPFKSVENLQRVPGIGPRTIDKNRERLRASSTTDTTRSENASQRF
jgi:competence ComEA-like helix-hairpin-helix protein